MAAQHDRLLGPFEPSSTEPIKLNPRRRESPPVLISVPPIDTPPASPNQLPISDWAIRRGLALGQLEEPPKPGLDITFYNRRVF